MSEFEQIPAVEIIKSQIRQMIDQYGIAAIEKGVDAVKKDLQVELAQTNVYKTMKAYCSGAYISKEGNVLVVADDRAYRRSIRTDLHSIAETMERNPLFENVVLQMQSPDITARLVQPEYGITEVHVHITKE